MEGEVLVFWLGLHLSALLGTSTDVGCDGLQVNGVQIHPSSCHCCGTPQKVTVPLGPCEWLTTQPCHQVLPPFSWPGTSCTDSWPLTTFLNAFMRATGISKFSPLPSKGFRRLRWECVLTSLLWSTMKHFLPPEVSDGNQAPLLWFTLPQLLPQDTNIHADHLPARSLQLSVAMRLSSCQQPVSLTSVAQTNLQAVLWDPSTFVWLEWWRRWQNDLDAKAIASPNP